MQLDFAAHIRHPERNPRPAGVEPRRMRIYNELFYNNIENFVAKTFPVCRSLFEAEPWHQMVRDFVHRHSSRSPYFVEISEEFLGYLQNERSDAPAADDWTDPPFLIELCHYEWVELALDLAPDVDWAEPGADPDLLSGVPAVSELAWSLQYVYPVHEIGPEFRPSEPPSEPTYLVVYRNRHDRVRFMESNVITARLLQLLGEGNTGMRALNQIAAQLELGLDEVLEKGQATLKRLADCDIITGVVE